jgi:ribosome biogenesis protein Tsr3
MTTMILSKQERAEKMSANSHLTKLTCLHILGDYFKNNKRGLSVTAEKLLTAEQNETLKRRGLTILDCLIGTVDDFDYEVVGEMFAEWNERLGEKIFILPVEA